jgi:predicted PurR-regulated permease PerM
MEEFKKRATFVVLIVVVSSGLLFLLWEARYMLLLLFAGLIGALMLTTLTTWFQSWFHIRSRGLAYTLVLCAGIAALTIGIWLRGPALAQQFGKFHADITVAAHQLSTRLQQQKWTRWIIEQSTDSTQVSRTLSFALTGIGGAMYLTASTVVGLFLVAMTSLYLAAEPDFYLRGIRRILPASHRVTIETCLASAKKMLRIWLLAKFLSMLIIGVFVTIGLFALRIPLAGTLGIIAGLLTFIPNLGPILSVVPAAMLAFAISPTKGFLTIALFVFAHLLEGNVVTPIAERKIVTLPPALTLAIQLLLATVTGVLGVALAAPLTAVLLGVLGVFYPTEPKMQSTST